MKTCPKCKVQKPFDAFYRSSLRKDGFDCWCKLCDRAKQDAAKKKDPEGFRLRQKEKRLKAAEKANNLPPDWQAARLAVERPGAVKKCAKCSVLKLTSEFPGCSTNANGLYSHCRACVCAASDLFYQNLSPEEKKRRRVRNAPANAEYRKNNPNRVKQAQRWASIKHTYGLTKEAVLGMLAAQGHKCALCLREIGIFGPHKRATANIDHCHLTGSVRALLCGWCNTSLGRFQDSPELLRRAAEYLEKYK